MGSVMENRAEVNDQREAGSEGWITKKGLARVLSSRVKTAVRDKLENVEWSASYRTFTPE